MLRFDVETISIATIRLIKRICQRLRFDVETISIATTLQELKSAGGCGLM